MRPSTPPAIPGRLSLRDRSSRSHEPWEATMNRRTFATLAAGVLLGWPAIALTQASTSARVPVTREVRTPADRVAPAAAPGWLASREDLRQLQEIQTEGARRVAELAKQAQGLRPGLQLTSLQREVERVKLETRLSFLETLAALARARGDAALADEAARFARQLRAAPAAAGPGVDMPREKTAPQGEVRP